MSEFEINTTDFHRNTHRCPICSIREKSIGRKPDDLIGKRFGKLIVLEYIGIQKWKCQCDCGGIAYPRTDSLKDGHTKSCGCISSKGEELISSLLLELNIKFYPQKIFQTCRFPDTNALARFDFYIPEYGAVIEYNGSQHYTYREKGWNTKERMQITQKRDKFKENWCKSNGIKFISISYTDYNKINSEYLLHLLKE